MIVGVPRETKSGERRVALAPEGAFELVSAGHSVLVEAGAGEGSAFGDALYRRAGAEIVAEPESVFTAADLIVKVKEPLEKELELMHSGQILLTFLHVAAYPHLGDALIESGVTAIGYETVCDADGALPLLAPMSEIAGRIAAQAGAFYLQHASGGRGVLMGGISGVTPADVVVIGAGAAGMNAAAMCAGMDANVSVLDIDIEALRRIDATRTGRVTTVMSSKAAIHEYVSGADLVIGAVLSPGHTAPVVVTEETVRKMREGSVVVDLSIDQGGCIASSRETTHDDPVYKHAGIVHYCVGNVPAAVPHTATKALTNATLPYIARLADNGLVETLQSDASLRAGVQFHNHEVTCEGVALSLGRPLLRLD